MLMLLLWLMLLMLIMLLLLILLLLPSLVWCWYIFSSFCYVYLSCVTFNLALNYNPLILFYHAIYFLTLSIFILSFLLFTFLLYLFFRVVYQDMTISRFLLSQNSTHPRCLILMVHYLYILPALLFLFDIPGNSYEVYLGFLLSYFWNPRQAPMSCMAMCYAP